MIFIPCLTLTALALLLDIASRHFIKKVVNSSTMNRSENERQKLDAIPRRAVVINFALTILWMSFRVGKYFILDEENKLFFHRGIGYLMITLRNFVFSRIAFQANQRIRRETVDDRRRLEILDAKRRREERRIAKEEQDERNTLPSYMIELQDISVIGAKYAGRQVDFSQMPEVVII